MLLGALCFAQDSSNPKTSAMAKKLDSIIIPTVEFRAANVADVVEFIAKVAKENDAEKAGVNIVLMDQANTSKVTIILEKVPLHTMLKLVAEQTGLSLGNEDDAIVLRKRETPQISSVVPAAMHTIVLQHRKPSAVKQVIYQVIDFAEKNGVLLTGKSTVAADDEIGVLILVSHPANMYYFRQLVDALDVPPKKENTAANSPSVEGKAEKPVPAP
jgi:type II secretory pathway component GspD/PulD (secretin)